MPSLSREKQFQTAFLSSTVVYIAQMTKRHPRNIPEISGRLWYVSRMSFEHLCYIGGFDYFLDYYITGMAQNAKKHRNAMFKKHGNLHVHPLVIYVHLSRRLLQISMRKNRGQNWLALRACPICVNIYLRHVLHPLMSILIVIILLKRYTR